MSEIIDCYYSMLEIRKQLEIGRDTALHWIATKNMPAHKIGKNCKLKVS
ncbi:MAG: excisionase [Clostridia bacterium]|nr:excisionase [Clostridia bacterium]